MINIIDKHNCCGCGSCFNACPKGCIKMSEDEEGFIYPEIDITKCIDCGICEKVCPFSKKIDNRKPIGINAAINPNIEERMHSSSGGIFSMLARSVLLEGGVVFGAAFDKEWNVHHIAIEREEELSLLQGSKYVQSRIGTTYRDVKSILKKGRLVLFSGTPCQVAGLRLFLGNDYKNLLTVDVICHGVPSPRVWSSYLQSIRRLKETENSSPLSSLNQTSSIESISFRDKEGGWKNFGFAIQYSHGQRELDKMLGDRNGYYVCRESLHKNLYLQGFLKNIYLRPSCYKCKVRCGKSGSDVSLGDFWGIQKVLPKLNDDKGVSLVITYSVKGDIIIKKLGAFLYEAEYEDAVRSNPCLESSVPETKYRELFWSTFSDDDVCNNIKSVLNKLKPSPQKPWTRQAIEFLYRLLKPRKWLKD